MRSLIRVSFLLAVGLVVLNRPRGAGGNVVAGRTHEPQALLLGAGSVPGRHRRRLDGERPHLARRQRRRRRDRRRAEAGRLPRLVGPASGPTASRPPTPTASSISSQDAADTTSTRSSRTSAAAPGRTSRRSTATPSSRLDELRRRHRLRHEPEAPAEGRLDRPDAGARRHRHARPRREPRRRPDRRGGDARVGALRLRPAGDLHHPDAAAARSRPGSRSTAATTRRRRASTGSATRTASSTPSSRGRTRTGRASGRRGCGMHNVNATSDCVRQRHLRRLDASSPATSTPRPSPTPTTSRRWQDGWLDAQGSENGDKCAWLDTQNITLGGHAFAVQPMWSNEAFDATGNGCVVSR